MRATTEQASETVKKWELPRGRLLKANGIRLKSGQMVHTRHAFF